MRAMLVVLLISALAGCQLPFSPEVSMTRLSLENGTGLVIERVDRRVPYAGPSDSVATYINDGWTLISAQPIPDGARVDYRIPSGCWDFRVTTEEVFENGHARRFSAGKLDICVGKNGYTLRPVRRID
jgi:hypothetical protein